MAVILFLINILPLNFIPGVAQTPAELMWLGNSWAGWAILFILAAFPTLGGYGLYNVSLSLLPSSIANLIVTTEPAFTAFIAYFLLGERLNTWQAIGSALLLVGVAFLRIYEEWVFGRLQREGTAGTVSMD